MKALLKKIIPKSVLLVYHKALAMCAAFYYRFPSRDIVVIGVTGTNGKSTTCNLIARVLEAGGSSVGMMTTVNYKIGSREWINTTRMTMLSRFRMQKMLRQMVREGCRYAVIETSSEGLMQHRNWGIDYDVAVFTNLTPEHIEAHGSFQKYMMAKGRLFASLSQTPSKILDGNTIEKIIVANVHDTHANYFLSFAADQKVGYGLEKNERFTVPQQIASDTTLSVSGTSFVTDGVQVRLKLLGEFNVYNALAAICVGKHFGLSTQMCADALGTVQLIPGRMEVIDEGQDFTVIVDYAHDHESFETLFKTLSMFKKNRIIHVFGSAGGVRDHQKRRPLGDFSARHADITIITDEDSYDEPVQKILDEIAAAAVDAGKRLGDTLFTVIDRGEAIRRACELAQTGDLVIITGKGAEQSIKSFKQYGKMLPWDDRESARVALRSLRK